MKKVVKVSFEVSSQLSLNSKEKHYCFFTDLDVQEGELVVVECSNGYGVAKVVGEATRKHEMDKANAWVVCKVDIASHEERLEKQKQIAIMKAKLQERKSALEEKAIYAMLAEKDPTMKEMLEKLEELEG